MTAIQILEMEMEIVRIRRDCYTDSFNAEVALYDLCSVLLEFLAKQREELQRK